MQTSTHLLTCILRRNCLQCLILFCTHNKDVWGCRTEKALNFISSHEVYDVGKKNSTPWKFCAEKVCVLTVAVFFLPSIATAQWWAGFFKSARQDGFAKFLCMTYFIDSTFGREQLLCTPRLPFLLSMGIFSFNMRILAIPSMRKLHGVSPGYDTERIFMEKIAGELMHAVSLNLLLPGIHTLYLNCINFWLSALPA